MKKLLVLILLALSSSLSVFSGSFYSQGSLAPESLSSWNSLRTGEGTSPANFSSGDVFIIQDGHSMSNNANWSISGTGSRLWIESGGSLVANFTVTLAKATSFQIDDGASYIHNNTGTPSSTIFNGLEAFSPNSTFWIKNWIGNLSSIPYGITWGDLIIDVPALNGSWNQVGNLFLINGTLDIRQTGGGENEFRLCSRSEQTYNFNIAEITVSGGILVIEKGGSAGIPTMNTIVSGDVTVTGGKLDLGTHGTSTLSIGGDLTISGTGKMMNSGTSPRIIFSKTGVQNLSVSPEGMNTSLIIADINSGSIVEMNTDWEMNHLSTLNIYGTLNMNGFRLKPRAVNIGGILNLNGGILDQIGTAAIIAGGPSLGNSGTINCDGTINMSATSFSSFLVQPGGIVNLNNGNINMNHNSAAFFIDTGGLLNCGSGIVSSINSTLSTFILNPGGRLEIGASEGISLSGSSGNIQVGGQRNFHYDADYFYSGNSPQWTGDGLPCSLGNLTINNGTGVSLTQNTEVTGNFTINASGRFVLPAGVNMTVSGTTTLLGPECLNIRTGGSFIDNGEPSSGNGTAKVEKEVTAGGWHYISSPFVSAVSGIFTGDYMKTYEEGTNGFGPNITSILEPLLPIKGFAVWPTVNHRLDFVGGQLNTGALETTVSRSFTSQIGNNEYDGWNLVGNPYPSAVDLDLVYENWENIEETAYFWDPSLSGGNYRVYPVKAGIGTHSQFVPATQGFFVYCEAPATPATPGTGIIRFNNASRVHSSEPFLKEDEVLSDFLRIKVTGIIPAVYDEIVVHFDPETTAAYDPGYDAYKLWGLQEAPQLYALTENEKRVTVNVLPFDKATINIPMGFKAGSPGEFVLKAEGRDSFSDEVSVILEDLKLHTTRDLKYTPEYRFSSDENDLPERFILRFVNQKLDLGQEKKSPAFNIWFHDGEIVIENGIEDCSDGKVFVYDLVGREMVHFFLDDRKITRFRSDLCTGWYLVKVITNKGVFLKLIYFY